MELTRCLADNIVETSYEDLPREVIGVTKRSIFDTLGVMFPPSTLERACTAMYELLKDEGKGQCTVVGFGGKTSCLMAAFLNGTLSHPMDYDDVLDETGSHTSSSTFPAALAIAEKLGSVSGKEFITAIALGNDLHVRLLLAPKGKVYEDYPWFSVSTAGVFGATAAAGKLLKLSHEEMVNALGIALNRVYGISEVILDPDSEMRAIREGFTAKEGVLAALIAKVGVAANKDGIEKLYKFFYGNNYDPEVLTDGLGREFRGDMVSFKLWPCCRCNHGFVQAVLDIVKDVDHRNIEEVNLLVSAQAKREMLEPVDKKRSPRASIEAKLALPFVLGIALAKKRVTIADFLTENLTDPDVLRIAERVRYKVEPGIGYITPVVVEVKTKEGKSFSKRVDVLYGQPQNPIGEGDLVAKFRDCAGYAKKPLSEDKLNQVIQKVRDLEKVKDMMEITELLA